MIDELYVKRMTAAVDNTTKHDIVKQAYGTILDVGCADGTLLTKLKEKNSESELWGIEPNRDFYKICKGKGLNVINSTIEDIDIYTLPKFDTIIFSSVLHEISSYSDVYTFTVKPIKNALNIAYTLLKSGGQILIRDGVGTDDTSKLLFSFNDCKDSKFVYKFNAEFVGRDYLTSKYNDSNKVISTISSNEFLTSVNVAKEFFFTYTWGETSWPREKQEIYGILSLQEWNDLLDYLHDTLHLRVEFKHTHSEEYAKYVGKKIKINTGKSLTEIFNPSVITLTLVKD